MNLSKIILIGPLPPPFTGQSVSFDMLSSEFNRLNIDHKTINISRGLRDRVGSKGIIRIYQILSSYINLLKSLISGSRIGYITISQSRYGLMRDILYVFTLKLFKAKVVAHLKGGNYDKFYYSSSYFVKLNIKFLLKMLDKVIVLGDKLVSMYDFIPAIRSKITVVNNGLSIDKCGKSKTYNKGDQIKIVFLSNLIESKGYLDLLKAINLLINHYDLPVQVYFAGEFMDSLDSKKSVSDLKEHFFEYINENSLERNINILGNVDGEEKWRLLQDSHFFCLPTNYANEGQPVSIIEAMAFGCIILSTNFRAIPDLLKDGINGYFVKYNDPSSIAKMIDKIISQGKFDMMSKNSLEIYKSNFTRKIHLKNLIFEIQN